MINNLISGITGTEIDNYKQYLVPLDRFINLYDIDTDIDLSKATSYNIIINIYKENNVVSKVTLDLTNYKLYTTGQIESYIINIYYYNVNNVSDFSKHYNQMIGGQS